MENGNKYLEEHLKFQQDGASPDFAAPVQKYAMKDVLDTELRQED